MKGTTIGCPAGSDRDRLFRFISPRPVPYLEVQDTVGNWLYVGL